MSIFFKAGLPGEPLPGLINGRHYDNHSSGGARGQGQDAARERQADSGVDPDAEAETEAGGGAEDAAGAREPRTTRAAGSCEG